VALPQPPRPPPQPRAKPAPVLPRPPHRLRARAPPRRQPGPALPTNRSASEAETTVRVDTARLDDIMNMVGELVLVRNRLVRLGLNSGDEAMQRPCRTSTWSPPTCKPR
jgi:two-component system, chemotaxis family, sensor kinase CheA